MSKLTIRAEPNDDGIWRLWLELTTLNFSGRGWAWTSPLDIEDFALNLLEYPMKGGDVATLALGYNDLVGDDLRISITVLPAGNLGALEVHIQIAEEDNPSFRLRARMPTAYAQRDRFAKQLLDLAKGTRTEAMLEGS